MKKCNFLIAMLLCFLCVSCVERYVKQAVPAQGHGKVKLENVKDGKYSQAVKSSSNFICQLILLSQMKMLMLFCLRVYMERIVYSVMMLWLFGDTIRDRGIFKK